MLGFEPKEKGLIEEKPKNIKKESILPLHMVFLTLAISLTAGLLALFLFWYFKNNILLARTITFATLATISLVYIFAFKNLKRLIIRTDNFFQNKYLILGVIYGFSLIFLAIYLPYLNRVLGIVPLNAFHWLLVFSVAAITTLWVEAVKIIANKKT